MYCPNCKTKRSRILRTQPDPDSTSREVTWQCRNPNGKTIFVTWESVTRILDDHAKSHTMAVVAKLLARMSPQQFQQVLAIIEGM